MDKISEYKFPEKKRPLRKITEEILLMCKVFNSDIKNQEKVCS